VNRTTEGEQVLLLNANFGSDAIILDTVKLPKPGIAPLGFSNRSDQPLTIAFEIGNTPYQIRCPGLSSGPREARFRTMLRPRHADWLPILWRPAKAPRFGTKRGEGPTVNARFFLFRRWSSDTCLALPF